MIQHIHCHFFCFVLTLQLCIQIDGHGLGEQKLRAVLPQWAIEDLAKDVGVNLGNFLHYQ